MTDKEQAVRAAARAHFDAMEHRKALEAMNVPGDYDERRALHEALAVAEAEERTCAAVLAAAQIAYARSL